MWNKAYVIAHYPGAYASRWSNGRTAATWNVFWGPEYQARRHLPRRAPTARMAWQQAAEIIEREKRARDDGGNAK